MDEWALRLLVVLLLAAAAVGWGVLSRRGTPLRRRRVRLEHLGPGLLVFTAAGCGSCDEVLETARRVGVDASRVAYEEQPEVFARHGIQRVPAIALVDEAGEGWLAEGVPSERRLRSWVGERPGE